MSKALKVSAIAAPFAAIALVAAPGAFAQDTSNNNGVGCQVGANSEQDCSGAQIQGQQQGQTQTATGGAGGNGGSVGDVTGVTGGVRSDSTVEFEGGDTNVNTGGNRFTSLAWTATGSGDSAIRDSGIACKKVENGGLALNVGFVGAGASKGKSDIADKDCLILQSDLRLRELSVQGQIQGQLADTEYGTKIVVTAIQEACSTQTQTAVGGNGSKPNATFAAAAGNEACEKKADQGFELGAEMLRRPRVIVIPAAPAPKAEAAPAPAAN